MTRLLVHVEGEAEETFVNEILCDHLHGKGYAQVSARLLGNARLRARRGGIRPWSTVREDILRHLREDRGSVATTFVDYYALPATGGRAWPGREQANGLPHEKKAASIEIAIHADIVRAMGSDFDPQRFVPFVVMHEFEALLFSNCQAFAHGIGRAELASLFQAIRDEFETPEHINDSPITAPSKRVLALLPSYNKPWQGNLAVLEIGLEPIRQACPHFNDWLTRLENGLLTSRS